MCLQRGEGRGEGVRFFHNACTQCDPLTAHALRHATQNLTSGSPPWAVRMEATPRYLFHPAVPGRVHQVLPGMRLLVLLREPLKRVVSHFNMEFLIRREQGE